jgi:alpha/beta superfamily hydrolase
MKVYFAHGMERGPWGTKITRLAVVAEELGCGVESIDYTDTMDPEIRAERLVTILSREQDGFVLAGSSMGGYVSLVASESVEAKAVFLMAPALYVPGFKKQQYHSRSSHIEIVHGWSDDVIPAQNSIKFARHVDCSLHLISEDHSLNGSLDVVADLFERFLYRAMV